MPIHDYVHARFCGIFTPLNYHEALAVRRERIVRTGGLIPDFADAIEEFQKAADLSRGEPYFRAWLGYGYAVSGQAGKARKVLNQLKNLPNSNYLPPYDVAAIWVGLGEKDQALKWLQRSSEDHAPYYPAINVEPVFDPLRSDQRFQDLVRHIAFPR